MSQKSSLMKTPQYVPGVLTSDNMDMMRLKNTLFLNTRIDPLEAAENVELGWSILEGFFEHPRRRDLGVGDVGQNTDGRAVPAVAQRLSMVMTMLASDTLAPGMALKIVDSRASVPFGNS